jgi:carboxyl-terminal processing protease
MDIAQVSPERSRGERIARVAVVAFLALALLTLIFGLGWAARDASTDSSATSNNSPIDGKLLDEIYDVLKQNYVDKSQLTPDKIQAAAIQGIINSLHDPHTSYLTPADLKSGELDLNSTYEGIGASISQQDSNVVIVSTFRGSPAEKAGIKPGDVILGVNGQSASGWSSQEVVNHIRGKSGTSVSINVRHSDGKEATVSVTRAEIPRQSVFTDPQTPILPGKSGTELVGANGNPVTDLAYINISQFHDKTYDELVNVLKEPKYNDAKGILLDMRGNPGGLLQAVVDIADEFLDKGKILTEKDANGDQRSWTAKPGGLATNVPIVILLDKSSASGAEVLAGALRDNGRAKIVGMPSFGKGTVNQLMPLNDCGDPKSCGAIYVSVGRWYTPNGTQIEGIGLKPDYQVDLTQDIYDKSGDVQMLKAIDVLQQEVSAVH